MPSIVPNRFYPVALIQDRYQGVYSDGAWLAIACADHWMNGVLRATWVLESGPSEDDITAGLFWAQAPGWIASGATPDLAIEKLLGQADHIDDPWSPPAIALSPDD